MRLKFCATGFMLLITSISMAVLKPAGLFGDSMVLQRGTNVPVWGSADAGAVVEVSIGGQVKRQKADERGGWKLNLSPVAAGGPYEMKIASGAESVVFKDVYFGEVWLCSGQSNMDMTVAKEDRYWCGVDNEAEEVAAANYPLIRVFDVPFGTSDEPVEDVESKWEVCSPRTVGHFSAAAYFFARDLQEKIRVPIGLITTAYGASTAEAWTSRKALAAVDDFAFILDAYNRGCEYFDSGEAEKDYRAKYKQWQAMMIHFKGTIPPKAPKEPDNPHEDQHSPSVLYNAMVHPLVPYAIKGAIWYQGESNVPTKHVYAKLMETLIADWRSAWGIGDFPFLYVQLAAYKKPSDEPAPGSDFTDIRDAQLSNLSIPNTAMTVAIDIGDAENVHPKNKQEIGRRLSIQARALAYGEDIVCMGPIFDRMEVMPRRLRLYFKNAETGLRSRSARLDGFAVAGADGVYHEAIARIDGDSVIVGSHDVPEPLNVRYAWSSNPATASLYNAEGLPASPFKTD
ncbi:MAG: sialate O-acetylesterase [Phycisphaerae bacterium]